MTANQDTPPESTPPNRAIRKRKQDKDEIRYVPVQSIYKDLESMQMTLPFSAAANFSIANIPIQEWQDNSGARMGICLNLPWLTVAQQRVTAKMAEVSPDFLPYISIKKLAARMLMNHRTLTNHIREICKAGILRRAKILMWKVVNGNRVGQPTLKKCWQFNIKAILLTYIAMQQAEATSEGEAAAKDILQYSFEDFISQGKESESDSTLGNARQISKSQKSHGIGDFSETGDSEKSHGIGDFSETGETGDSEKSHEIGDKKVTKLVTFLGGESKGESKAGGVGENEKISDPSPPPGDPAAAEKKSAPKFAFCASCGMLFAPVTDPKFCPVHEKRGK